MACPEEAEAQLAEIDLLTSMFPSQEELVVDQLAFDELRAYVEGTAPAPPSTRPQFSIRINTDTSTVNGVTALSDIFFLQPTDFIDTLRPDEPHSY